MMIAKQITSERHNGQHCKKFRWNRSFFLGYADKLDELDTESLFAGEEADAKELSNLRQKSLSFRKK